MAYLVYDSKPASMIRDVYSELDDRLKVLEDKINITTTLSLWKNPAHKAYKLKRRKRR